MEEIEVKREMFYCYPYIYFEDKRFVEIFIGTDIDFPEELIMSTED